MNRVNQDRMSYEDAILVCSHCAGPRLHRFYGGRKLVSKYDDRVVIAVETLYQCECGWVRRWGIELPGAQGPPIPSLVDEQIVGEWRY